MIKSLFCSIIIALFFCNALSAQVIVDSAVQKRRDSVNKMNKIPTSVIVMNDGAEYVGKIITQDDREVSIITKNLGQIAIPKYQIKEIKEDLRKSGYAYSLALSPNSVSERFKSSF